MSGAGTRPNDFIFQEDVIDMVSIWAYCAIKRDCMLTSLYVFKAKHAHSLLYRYLYQKDEKKIDRAILIGVTSRGPAACGRPSSFGINTRIKMFLQWIKQNTGDDFQHRIVGTLSNGAMITNSNLITCFSSFLFYLV